MSVIISPDDCKKQQLQYQAHDLSNHKNFTSNQSASHSGEEVFACPRCQLPINNRQNRLVQDACGHIKCRICLLNEESGCFECCSNEAQGMYTELKAPEQIAECDEYNALGAQLSPSHSSPRHTPEELDHRLSDDEFRPRLDAEGVDLDPMALDAHRVGTLDNGSQSNELCNQRDKSPELFFERLPCGMGRGSDKLVSLPFKKSLRFPKCDSIGQKQVYSTDSRFASYSVVDKEDNNLEIVEDASKKSTPIEVPTVEEKEESAPVEIPPEKEPAASAAKSDVDSKCADLDDGKPAESEATKETEEDTKIKSKKKRGKKAEPLPSHIYVQEGVRKLYCCDVCKRSFSSRANVHYHASCGSTEKPFECSQCGKGFISITHYKIHIRSHSGKRPFVCVYCNKDFSQKGKLKRHMMLHTGERPYCCETCGKGFRDPNALTKHNLVHTNDRAFSCANCDKKFKEISNLKKHMVVHTKERPYTCETCGKSFGFVNALSHHKLIHTRRRDHVCRLCEKAFRLKRDLGRHMAIHSEKKAFKCPHCDVHVRRKDNLERHVRNTHPNGAAGEAPPAAKSTNTVAVINAVPQQPTS